MKNFLNTTTLTLFLIFGLNAQETDLENKNAIHKAIENMVVGIDNQNGEFISKAFWDDIAIFATRGSAILTVSGEQFIELHQQKKFGGIEREHSIKNLIINDNGIANAVVVAEGEGVYYEYYLGFTKKEGEWKVQTFLQHSEKR